MRPEPPADLWEKLANEIDEMRPKRPAESFTVPELAEKLGIGRRTAASRVAELRRLRKVTRHGSGTNAYYTLGDK